MRIDRTILTTKQLIACCLFAIGLAIPVKADFFVDDWVLSAGCINPFGFETDFNLEPQNPFNASLGVTLHNSMAASAYAFNWGLATGQFHINVDLASEGGNGGPFCGTNNRIDFSITQDTLLSIDGELSYQFSGGIRRSEIRFFVGFAAIGSAFWIRGDSADTVAGDPPTDTLHVSDSILLTPGSYFVRPLMNLSAVGGSPNSVSTAHGFANIQMTTVPSPAALGPLACAALLFIRKRPRATLP